MKASTSKLIKSTKIKLRTVRGSRRHCLSANLTRPAGTPRHKKRGAKFAPKLMLGCFIKRADAVKAQRRLPGSKGR